jgi:hypothetical protein
MSTVFVTTVDLFVKSCVPYPIGNESISDSESRDKAVPSECHEKAFRIGSRIEKADLCFVIFSVNLELIIIEKFDKGFCCLHWLSSLLLFSIKND